MSRRLQVEAAHTITGHTHRGGPEESEAEWELPGGGRLHNTGSWVYADAFHHPGHRPAPTGRGPSPGSRTRDLRAACACCSAARARSYGQRFTGPLSVDAPKVDI